MSGDWPNVQPGDAREFQVADLTRTHFARYAGASGDFNPIHHDQTIAEMAGLQTVFGMGMFTAGVLSRIPAAWFGPTSIQRYAVRFAARVWPGDTVTFSGKVVRVRDEGGTPQVDLELSAVNQRGETLITGEATVRPWQP